MKKRIQNMTGYSIKNIKRRWIYDERKSRLKLMLTEKYVKNRFEFCISKLDQNTGVLMSNYDTVHTDEKWLYVILEGDAFWLTGEEDIEYIFSNSMAFNKKIMPIATLTRPIFDVNWNIRFYGKIGIWPFTEIEKAKRSSKNRPKDTDELKPVVSMRKEDARDMIMRR